MGKHGEDTRERRFHAGYTPEPNSGCWLWDGATVEGYGCIRVKEGTILSHRLSWQLHRGSVPEEKFVLHKCDVRLCVNPAHLYIGDYVQNGRDAHARKRVHGGKGGIKLTTEQILAIREAAGPQTAIGRQFGISQSQVSMIKNRQSWAKL